jgi:hypothetical protein
MSLIGWLKGNRLVDVTTQDPLPVQQQGAITTRTPDTLLVATTAVTADANRDLQGSTATELPTLDNCMQYRKLVWFYFRAGGESTTYRVLARATDHNGAPLGTGWQEIVPATTLPGGANSWGRIEIPSAGDGYYDQYRIEVQRTAGNNYVLTSKIVGVR